VNNRIPGFDATLIDVTLCLSRMSRQESRPRCERC